ncbi:MAG: hypothetical protein JNL70_17245 [Saprospiraceae bacterium]|nr:hypothetical protein [Saprospiraceae bacterium]
MKKSVEKQISKFLFHPHLLLHPLSIHTEGSLFLSQNIVYQLFAFNKIEKEAQATLARTSFLCLLRGYQSPFFIYSALYNFT